MTFRWLNPRPVPDTERQLFSDAALKRMAVPLMLEHLLQLVVGIADTMMVSQAGEAVVSGVSLDTMLYRFFVFLFSAASTGGAVIVSQYVGRRRYGQAEKALAQVFFLSFVTSLISMWILLTSGDSLLNLLFSRTEPRVMDACRTYLRIVSLSFPACAVYNAGAVLYRSLGKTRITLRVSVAMNLINVAGNAVGIFVLRAGAAGVAWPTVFSWIVAAGFMTACCLRKTNPFRFRPRLALRPDREMILRIFRVAGPSAAEQGLFSGAKVVLSSLVAGFGTVQIAANGIAQTFWSLGACVLTSACPVFTTVIGQCIGADDEETAGWYMRKLTRLTLLFSVVWNVLVTLSFPLCLPLYAVSAETGQVCLRLVLIHNIFSAFLEPATMPLSSGLRAAGDVRFTLWSSVTTTVFFRTAVSFALSEGLGLGVYGIAWAMVMDWGLKSLLNLYRFRSGRWQSRKLI